MWSQFSPTRASLRALHGPLFRRIFSTKPAKFVTLDAQGLRVTRNVNVWMGDPHEAFVLIPTEIGDAMKASCQDQKILVPTDIGDATRVSSLGQICPLSFHHDSQHFSTSGLTYLATRSSNKVSPYLESASYPRLEIPQNLPRQTNTNTSPATLYLFGATHTVALDGTPDGKLYH